MTVTYKEEQVKGYIGMYLIYISQDKYSSAYRVGICRMMSENYAGFPINERTYGDMQKAKRRYRDLRKQVVNGEY